MSNCPGKNAIAVAELTFGLILALDRRIPDNVADLRAGRWNKKEYSKAKGLYGRTLGLLGFGHVAQEVARRAMAFGMPVLVWSRRFDGDPASGAAGLPDDLDLTIIKDPADVAAGSDVLSVHLALTAATRHFVGASILNRLKAGSYFVNTSRGEIVDHAALADVVRTRGSESASMSSRTSRRQPSIASTIRSWRCRT